jgi:hypothetical protein
MKRIAFVLSLIFVVGCAAEGHLTTPSGKPEVTINGSIKNVQNACLAWLLSHDYHVGSQIDTKDVVLAGEKDISAGLWKAYGASTWDRILFNFLVRDSTTVTVYANRATINRPAGVPASMASQNSQSDLEFLQSMLGEIAESVKKS